LSHEAATEEEQGEVKRYPQAVNEALDTSGIVSSETNPPAPSKGDFEAMARRRFQNPKPKRSGNFWWLLYRQDEFVDGKQIRKRKRSKIAPATMSEREVKKVATEFLRPLNQGLQTIGSATGFKDYVEATYIPNEFPLMSKSTTDRSRGVIENYLLPAFGELCLRDMSPLTIQKYLSGLATSKLSHESRDKIRDVLSSILGSAKKYEFLVRNPVEGLKLPKRSHGKRTKPYVTPEQFNTLVNLIPEPYATMTFVAVWTGLRISELIGLRWRNVHADSITVDERCCRGDWGAPKSEASNATIGVNRNVINRIHRLKTLTVKVKAGRAVRRYKVVKSCGPDDLVFQSVRKGAAMRDNNILCRFIKPAGRKLGLAFVNWRCLRTSHATWNNQAGVGPKENQTQMRHSKVSTTMDIYTQTVPESQRLAVEKLAQFVTGSSLVQ
jgi:integrase